MVTIGPKELRLVRGEVNLGEFAALDGATDDTAAWQAAQALAVAYEYTIYHPGGTSIVKPAGSAQESLLFTAGVSIRGTGPESVIKLGTVPDGSSFNFLMVFRGGSGYNLHDITLDANGAAQAAGVNKTDCLALDSGASDIRISNVTFRDARATAAFSGGYGLVSWNGGANRVQLSNLTFQDIGQSDIGLFEGTDWVGHGFISDGNGYFPCNVESQGTATIKRVTLSDWAITDAGCGAITAIQNGTSDAATGTVEDVTIADVRAYNTGIGNATVGAVRLRGTTRTTLRNIAIDTCASHGLYNNAADTNGVSQATFADIIDLTVDGLTITNLAAGKRGVNLLGGAGLTSGTYWLRGARLENLRVPDAPENAIHIDHADDLTLTRATADGAGVDGILITNSVNVTVDTPIVDGAGSASTGRGVSILNSTDFDVFNGRIKNCSGDGIRVTGSTSDRFRLTHNRCRGNTGYGVYITGPTSSPTWTLAKNQLGGNTGGTYFHDTASLTNVAIDQTAQQWAGSGSISLTETFFRGGAATNPAIYWGSGTPEGAVTAVVGSLYLRLDGGAGTSQYVKESGSGNTGWRAV